MEVGVPGRDGDPRGAENPPQKPAAAEKTGGRNEEKVERPTSKRSAIVERKSGRKACSVGTDGVGYDLSGTWDTHVAAAVWNRRKPNPSSPPHAV